MTETAESLTVLDDSPVKVDRSRNTYKGVKRTKVGRKTRTSLDADKSKVTSPKIDTLKDDSAKSLEETTDMSVEQVLDKKNLEVSDSSIAETSTSDVSETSSNTNPETTVAAETTDDISNMDSTDTGANDEISILEEVTSPQTTSTPSTISSSSQIQNTRPEPSGSRSIISCSTSTEESSLMPDAVSVLTRFECENCWFTSESKTELKTHQLAKHASVQRY